MTDKAHGNMPRNQIDIVLGTITDSRRRLERQEAFESEERYRDAGIKLTNERNEWTKKGSKYVQIVSRSSSTQTKQSCQSENRYIMADV